MKSVTGDMWWQPMENFKKCGKKKFHRQERKSYSRIGIWISLPTPDVFHITTGPRIRKIQWYRHFECRFSCALGWMGSRPSIWAWVATRTVYSEDVKINKRIKITSEAILSPIPDICRTRANSYSAFFSQAGPEPKEKPTSLPAQLPTV